MKFVTNLADHVLYNDRETELILCHVMNKNVLKTHELCDIKSHLYLSMLRTSAIEKYDPNNTTKFSTWVYRIILNFYISYYSQPGSREKVVMNSISLDAPIGDHNGEREGQDNRVGYYLSTQTNDNSFIETNIGLNQSLKYLREYDLYCGKRRLPHHKYLEYIMKGYSDTDISLETCMSVAGLGQQKRELARILKKIEDGSILQILKINKEEKLNGKRQRNYIKNGNAFPSCGVQPM